MARPTALEREPIFWTMATPGYNDDDRQRVRMVNGRRVLEKFPQHGHVGDYENPKKAPGVRFVYMINHGGFEIAMPLTNGASHLDPGSNYGRYMRRKAAFLGWFPPGMCPIALVQSGDLDAERHIVCKEMLADEPCEPGRHSRSNPCKHALSEKNARHEQHRRDEAERLASYKDPGEKLIEAQREQTTALCDTLREAINAKRDPAEMAALVEAIREGMRPTKGKRDEG